jgi:hypothetical protein
VEGVQDELCARALLAGPAGGCLHRPVLPGLRPSLLDPEGRRVCLGCRVAGRSILVGRSGSWDNPGLESIDSRGFGWGRTKLLACEVVGWQEVAGWEKIAGWEKVAGWEEVEKGDTGSRGSLAGKTSRIVKGRKRILNSHTLPHNYSERQAN